ncbi:uncharacterized protein LOC108104050 [Drosophila eugracilis]|uniref:uncharacterized protein LOC108104050 n=1 Tax=Drosophila eugracilis TaxID=29029 RepID=UPI001BD96ECA|nr:uncharacterized protein LOC108104050 [Drosophila eugracilis]
MAILVLTVILLLGQGILSQNTKSLEPLTKLNEIVTSRLKESLKEAQPGEFSSHYLKLQQAAELPFYQLDQKIMVFNEINVLQQNESSLNSTSAPVNQNDTLTEEASALRQLSDREFRRRVLRLLKRLGIYDSFTDRVFKAILSDEKQLRMLKKKLDSLGDDNKEVSKDALWSFIHDLF